MTKKSTQKTTFLPLRIIIFTLILITGCSTNNINSQNVTQSGRLAINSSNSEENSISANYSLNQINDKNGQLLLLSPLGNTLAKLFWTPESATLEMSGKQQQAESLNDLLKKITPEAPEAYIILDWLNGKATPNADWDVQRRGNLITAKRNDPSGKVTVVKVLLDR